MKISVSREIEIAAAENLKEKDYWLNRLADFAGGVEFPCDFLRPEAAASGTDTISFDTENDVFTRLSGLSKGSDFTLHIILTAVLSALLAHDANSGDVAVGTPIYRPEGTKGTIRDNGKIPMETGNEKRGFINTALAIRCLLERDISFKGLLLQAKERVLEAVENQNYPVEMLPEFLNLPGSGNRFPLFSNALVLDNIQETAFIEHLEPNILFVFHRGEHNLTCELRYQQRFYKRDTIERIVGRFILLLGQVLENLDIRLNDLELLTEEEKNLLLETFNKTDSSFPADKPVHIRFREQVEKTPGAVAVVGESPLEVQLTYGFLDAFSEEIAVELLERNIEAGVPVAMLSERQPLMVAAMLGILKTGAIYVPISTDYPKDRRLYILRDSGARALVTHFPLENPVGEIETLYFDGIFTERDFNKKVSLEKRRDGSIKGSDPAYAIYTSGTTGKPKGVLVEHASLVNLCNWHNRRFKVTERDHATQYAGIGFDASLWEIFPYLLKGAALHVVDENLKLDASLLNHYFETHDITVSFLPTQMCEQFLEEENNSLRALLAGGDKLRLYKETPYRLYNNYGPTENTIVTTSFPVDKNHENIPIGGPIDNTSVYILKPQTKDEEDTYSLRPIGIPGELCITGSNLARGYLNRPDLTQEKFTDSIPLNPLENSINQQFESIPNASQPTSCRAIGGPGGASPWRPLRKRPRRAAGGIKAYRSGDLARWLPDGTIEFLGRIDQQVKVRGFRIELGEIEARLMQSEGVKEAVVTARQDEKGETVLCAYYVHAGEKAPFEAEDLIASALRTFLAAFLPAYMIPAFFVQMEKLPLTPSGKVDTKALPDPVLDGSGLAYTAPRDDMEKKLVDIWSELLGMEPAKIGIDADFFKLGGHSLKAAKLIARMHKEFDVSVPMDEIFNISIIRQLAAYIKAAAPDTYEPVEPAEKKEYYPLSSAQKRLYVLEQMEEESTGYNIPAVFRIDKKLDREKLENAFALLIDRHDSFRTSFFMHDDEPAQRVHAIGTVAITPEYYPVTEAGDKEVERIIQKEFIRPFDLTRAPLLRLGFITGADENDILLLDMHHIVSDGISMDIMLRELAVLYYVPPAALRGRLCGGHQGAAPPGPPVALRAVGWDRSKDFEGDVQRLEVPVQYVDFVEWLKGESRRVKMAKQGIFWREQFTGEIPVLELPQDFPRPVVQRFDGNTFRFTISGERFENLKDLARRENATTFMMLTALFSVLLAKLSSGEDIVIGTPAAGRAHADLEKVIGMFVNTLALRTFPGRAKGFKQLLGEIKETTLSAFENQDYPFEELVEELATEGAIRRDASRNPLFDAMVSLMESGDNTKKSKEIIEDKATTLPLTPYFSGSDIAKFDLVLNALEAAGEMIFYLEYCVKLFKEETIQRFSRYFLKIAEAVARAKSGDCDIALEDIEIITEEERKEILYTFNPSLDEENIYPVSEDALLQNLFEKSAADCPHKIALKAPCLEKGGEVVSMTYGLLEGMANSLAEKLQAKGVGPDAIVAVMASPSVEMITALLAVLKSGGAYLPLDPSSPKDRVDYILKDSSSRWLLAAGEVEIPGTFEGEIFHLDSEEESGKKSDAKAPLCRAGRCNLAYVIYTSGSTGRPKGVLAEHGNVLSYLKAFEAQFTITDRDTVIQLASFTFDAFVEEVYPVLSVGGKLVMTGKEALGDVSLLTEMICREDVTFVDCSPLLLSRLNEPEFAEKLGRVHTFISGGDVLRLEYVKELMKKGTVFNTYGPTEGTVCATYYQCKGDEKANVPIGRVIDYYNVFIMAHNNYLLPIGVPGELCITGSGVARGYLNRPELTAKKFLDTRPQDPSKKNGNQQFESIPNASQVTNCRAIGGPGGAAPWCPPHRRPRRAAGGTLTYRTGDLARWLPDGRIEFLGRIDQQVKIRGFRIELGEIESRLSRHSFVKEAVVLDRIIGSGGSDEDKHLCAYIVPKEKSGMANFPEPEEFKLFLSQWLPEYMIPTFYIQGESIPMTRHGKIDRRALPLPQFGTGGTGGYVAPRNEKEKELVEIWARVLKLEKKEVGIDDNFFQLGGHSLKGTVMITLIHQAFNVRLTLAQVFETPTVRQLAEIVGDSVKDKYIPLEAVEEREYYELSYAQRRLWILSQFEEDASAYNMPFVYVLKGDFDLKAYEKAIGEVIRRHDSLRTLFIMVDGEPHQKILRHLPYELDFKDLRSLDEGEKERRAREIYLADANRAFDLVNGPLFLFHVLQIDAATFVSICNIHHIVNDGWSQGIITNELYRLYNSYKQGGDGSRLLEPVPFQYKDYSRWHNALIREDHFNRAQEYWLEKFKDKPNGIDLPLDHPRPPVQTFNGGRVSFIIDNAIADQLHHICAEKNTTLFMGLLLLCNVFLYRNTGQADIILGSPIAGRGQAELHKMVGFLVNTIVFRHRVNPGAAFRQMLEGVKEETLASYEYQDYPFNLLIDKLGLDRDLSQSPLFNVMIAHNNAETEESDLRMEGLEFYEFKYGGEFNMSKFDLIFFMDEFNKGVFVNVEYNSDLFDRRTIEALVENFQVLLGSVIAKENQNKPVSRLDCLSRGQREQLVETFNDTERVFPPMLVQELFENRVWHCPNAVATVWEDEAVTYETLNRRANQMAHYLREVTGVKRNQVIGIFVDRSIEMIAVILGVIKSGAGYLAVDPNYPEERIIHILEDSRAELLIVDDDRSPILGQYRGGIIHTGAHAEAFDLQPETNPSVRNEPGDILYVIYTSGSTGMPNGAMLSHHLLANLVQWQQSETTIKGALRCMQFTSINFCVSFQEIATTLTSGGQLHLIGDVERQDIQYLMDFISRRGIEIICLPFSYLNFLFNQSHRWETSFKHNLKHIVTAGEQLKVSAGLKRFLERNPHLNLHNHYGSSEMHVVTSYTLDAATAEETPVPPAGKPISNTRIFIMDEFYNLLPVGVWGEIFVEGASEILGYINNESLTESKLYRPPHSSQSSAVAPPIPPTNLEGYSVSGNTDPQMTPKAVRIGGPGGAAPWCPPHRRPRRALGEAPEAECKRWYRSGDIGRRLADGNIELRGRKDSQVKVRGFRVELGEIESKILIVKGVTDCVVVVKEDPSGQKSLVAYVVAPGTEPAGVRRELGVYLPQYMVPHLMKLEALPLMPNGKVDRERLPEPDLSEKGEVTAPRDRTEAALAALWARVLGLPKSQVDVLGNFFELGGHSLKATVLVSEIHKKLNVKVPLTEFFKTPTIAEIAVYIKESRRHVYEDIPPCEDREYYPLSAAQKRVYVEQRKDPRGTGYNMLQILILDGELDTLALAKAFLLLVERHESFRTRFQVIDGELAQVSRRSVVFDISYHGCRDGEPVIPESRAEALVREFIRPFDLADAPLLRVGLIRVEEDRHVLMVDMHHIISDGVSYGIFVRELASLYDGKTLRPLPLQYRDYSMWQNSEPQKEEMAKQENVWLSRFETEAPRLQLPYDFRKPEQFRFEGDIISFEINKEQMAALAVLGREEEATFFMMVLTLLAVFLSRLTGQEDLVLGIPVAGRPHADLQQVIGMFVNTLPLRCAPAADLSFKECLKTLKIQALNSFENQDYPLDQLVEQLAKKHEVSGETGRGEALFNVLFSYQTIAEGSGSDLLIKLPGLDIKHYDAKNRVAKNDLTLEVYEKKESLFCILEYRTQLFRPETIELMRDRFLVLLENILANPDSPIGELEFRTTAELSFEIDEEEVEFDF